MFLPFNVLLLQFGFSKLQLNLDVKYLWGLVMLSRLLEELLLKILCAIESHLILKIVQDVFVLFSLNIQPKFYCIKKFTYLLSLQWFFKTIFLYLWKYILYASFATEAFLIAASWIFRQIVTTWPIYPFLHFWLPDPALIFWSSSASAIKKFKSTSLRSNLYKINYY